MPTGFCSLCHTLDCHDPYGDEPYGDAAAVEPAVQPVIAPPVSGDDTPPF